MRGRLAYRGPDPDDVRGVRGHGPEGGARPQVRREASLNALHPTGGHLRTRAVNPGEGRTRGGGAERRSSIPPGNRLHRRSAASRGRPGTNDRAKEDEGLARERIAHERAGVVDPPRLARNDLPHPSPVTASRPVQRAELHFRNSLPPGPRKRAPREPRRVPRPLARGSRCSGQYARIATTTPKFMSANPMSISPTALRSRGSNPASIRCQRLRRTSMLRLSASDGRENR